MKEMTDKEFLHYFTKTYIGKKVKIDYGDGNLNTKTIRVVAMVDKEYVVFKTWSERKQEWIYEIRYYFYFKRIFENNYIKECQRSIV